MTSGNSFGWFLVPNGWPQNGVAAVEGGFTESVADDVIWAKWFWRQLAIALAGY